MSFLSKLSALKKNTPVRNAGLVPDKKNDNITTDIDSLLPKHYVRDEDPAVKRLKELRRREQIKNGEFLKKTTKSGKNGNGGSKAKKSRKDDEDGGSHGTVYKRKVGSSSSSSKRENTNMIKRREPLKKMTFEELMKQAEQNDKVAEKSPSIVTPTVERPKKIYKPGFKSRQSRITKPMSAHTSTVSRRNKSPSSSPSSSLPVTHDESKEKTIKISAPTNKFAQPNAKLKRKLEQKGYRPPANRYRSEHGHRRGRGEEEVDSELDDFIEDDEEEPSRRVRDDTDAGYDRDEIWAMFNKGRSRPHYYNEYDEDEGMDDYDDMEANEMEIMEEEEYATKMARLEDKKEEAWLKRHEEEKRRLKKRRG